MIPHVSDSASTVADLTALLERIRLQPAGAKTPAEVNRVQLDLLLARIGLLTEALRGAAGNETTRLATRMLLADLALVAGRFRGDTNATSAALSGALEGIARALAQSDASPTAD